jgi:hypothetical protein
MQGSLGSQQMRPQMMASAMMQGGPVGAPQPWNTAFGPPPGQAPQAAPQQPTMQRPMTPPRGYMA